VCLFVCVCGGGVVCVGVFVCFCWCVFVLCGYMQSVVILQFSEIIEFFNVCVCVYL
jgi:hypothetical protein